MSNTSTGSEKERLSGLENMRREYELQSNRLRVMSEQLEKKRARHPSCDGVTEEWLRTLSDRRDELQEQVDRLADALREVQPSEGEKNGQQ